MKRQIFYSFHFKNDCWRTGQVRNIGTIEGNKPVSENDWEEVKKKGDENIKKWINDQLKYRSCTVVLIGSETSKRKWVKYEIEKSWNDGKGVLGIYIHNLEEVLNSFIGEYNMEVPIYSAVKVNGKKLSDYVKTYNPPYGADSKANYNYIAENIEDWIETAINDRK